MYSSANNICRVRPKDAKLGVRSLVASVAIETEAAMNSKENLSPGRIADTVQAYDSFRDDDETIEEQVLPVLLPATEGSSSRTEGSSSRKQSIRRVSFSHEQFPTHKCEAGDANGSSCKQSSSSPGQSTAVSTCTCNAGWWGPDGSTCKACDACKCKSVTGDGDCSICPVDSSSPAQGTALTEC